MFVLFPCSHNALGQCPEPWLWKQACSSCEAGPDSQKSHCLQGHICLKTLVYIPVLSFFFIFVRGEPEAGVTVWFKAQFSQGINCLSFCWHFSSAEKNINSWSSLVLFSMEPGRGIPPKSNIHELAHLIKLFKGKHSLTQLLLEALQSVGCSVKTWSLVSPVLHFCYAVLGGTPWGISTVQSWAEQWEKHEGKAVPPHCRHSAFWHRQSKHAESAFLYPLFHVSNFRTVLKTINFCSRRIMLGCVYLAASLRKFREASVDFHVLFNKCEH